MPDGNEYEGEWDDQNVIDGFGTLYYIDGSIYEGNFKKGMRCGKGRMIYANTNIYEGDWVNDLNEG